MKNKIYRLQRERDKSSFQPDSPVPGSFEEITFKVRNVAADIKKILMIDPSRGNRVQFTKFLNSGHAIEEIDYRMEFFVYVTLNIGYRNIISNPSIYG